MATIEKYLLQDGATRYMVRYRKPDKTQTNKRGFRRKIDAELFLNTVEVHKVTGTYIDPAKTNVTIGELGPLWLERKRTLKPSAHRPLEIAWRLHVEPNWGKHKLGSIVFTDVQAWVTKMSTGDAKAKPPMRAYSATSVIRSYGVLAAILDDAVKDRRLPSNPARGVDLPRKVRKPQVYLSHDDVARFADASNYPLLVRVLAYTGLRWGEAVALRIQDVNLLKRRLHVEQNAVRVDAKVLIGTPKTHEQRKVAFPKFLSADIEKACVGKHREDLLFPGPNGSYMRPPHTGKNRVSWFDAAVKASGIPRITPHDLRHSYASFAVSAGANVKVLQKNLGHKSAAMTLDVYAELFDDDLNAVADALDDAVSPRDVPKV